MNRYVLDTNFICSILNSLDFLHEEAIAIFKLIEENSTFIIPFTVYLELAVQKAISLHDVKDFLKLLNIEVSMLSLDDIDTINSQYLSSAINLKPIDFSIFYVATKLKAKLLTFDEKLLKHLDKDDYKY